MEVKIKSNIRIIKYLLLVIDFLIKENNRLRNDNIDLVFGKIKLELKENKED